MSSLTLVSVIPCVLVIPGNFSMTGILVTLVIPGIPVFLPFLVSLGNCQDSGHKQDRGGTGGTGKSRTTRFTEETRKHDAPQTFTWN